MEYQRGNLSDDLKDFNSDDFIHDNNDKAENLLPIKSVEIKKHSVLLNTSGLHSKVSDNLQNNVKFQPNEAVSIAQKKVVLDIFKNNSCSHQDSKIHQQNSLINDNEKLFEYTSIVTGEHGKELILNVFQKNIEKSNKSVVKSVLKISDHENKFKRKKNVAFVDSPGETNIAKKICIEKINKLQELKSNDKYNDQENQRLDLQKLSIHKSIKVSRVKQAIIRKFPGPAGILPDEVNENDVIDLDYLDENKNNKSNQYADICSQNTKNLFSTGAWQLMMDDLPAGFELCDIATIKENALQYSKTYKKVPYLAGIVQCIDYKPNDPHIILKDLSGKVDACIHHSICKLYPNALGTSVVILAKDIGLIVTSKKFVCVIISLNNLVSIYSDEARLVETSHLKTLLKNDNVNQNLHESEISVLDEIECQDNIETLKTHSQDIENKLQKESGLILKNLKKINSSGISELDIGRKDNSQEFDLDEDNAWLGINIDELNSFKPNQFPSSTPIDANENNANEVHFQIKKSEHVLSKITKHSSESEKIQSDLKLSNSADKQKMISDKLSIFRNTNNTSMPSTALPVISKPFESEGNDTDDEMLSQLDVDAIAASYKTQNC
ncbi:uncharacterized protein LOC131669206 isoform X2 [Phymastichus coffea]|uniref:uncharacterized protein LOC131669206 isoform X2 n=1 Tax=Phymastichus coffea TaxID=108790 RepID=UPI00273B1C0C|nr:uncharacterized protein LOC131669206 isoform X2 [Phymastichus coffea]